MLVASRLFSEAMNFPLQSAEYTMQRFTVILLAKIALFVIYLPLIFFARKYEGESVITVMGRKCKPVAWIFGVAVIILMTIASILTLTKVEFYTTSTIFGSAPSALLITLIVLVCAYAIYKGIQSLARMSVLVTVALIIFIAVVIASTSQYFDFSFLYTNFLEKPDKLWQEIAVELQKNTEIYAFLVLMEYVRNKPQRAVYFSIPVVFVLIELLVLTESLVFGPYLGELNFPFFVLSALSDIIIFQRLDGIDVALWTLISVIRLSLYTLSAKTIMERLLGKKAGFITAGAMLIAVAAASIYISGNRQYLSFSTNYIASTIILVTFVAVVPLIFLFFKKRGRDVEKKN